MGTIISFEERAVATLRQRLGAAEEANQDLIAFARGHSGATSAIHQAVLGAIAAPSLDDMIAHVTRAWPACLGLDAVALALIVGDSGFRADNSGIQRIEPRLIDKALRDCDGVALRSVAQGHPLFAAAAPAIRCEALIAIDAGVPMPRGVLALGHGTVQKLDGRHGAQLLQFLGDSLGAIIARWLTS